MSQPSNPHRPSVFFPILLVGVGTIWLLSNLGLLPSNPWMWMWQWWPLLLIGIGLEILFKPSGLMGNLMSAGFALAVVVLLIVLAFTTPGNPGWSPMFGFGNLSELRTERITQPLGDFRHVIAAIDFPGGQHSIRPLADADQLMTGEVTHYGNLINTLTSSAGSANLTLRGPSPSFGHVNQKWALALNPKVEYDLSIDAASGSYDFDFSQMTLRSLDMDAGSGAVTIALPGNGQYRFRLDGGSGAIQIRVPSDVAVRVEYDAGSGALNAPNLIKTSGGSKRDGTYENANFSQSGAYVIIKLNGGSGAVTIR